MSGVVSVFKYRDLPWQCMLSDFEKINTEEEIRRLWDNNLADCYSANDEVADIVCYYQEQV